MASDGDDCSNQITVNTILGFYLIDNSSYQNPIAKATKLMQKLNREINTKKTLYIYLVQPIFLNRTHNMDHVIYRRTMLSVNMMTTSWGPKIGTTRLPTTTKD